MPTSASKAPTDADRRTAPVVSAQSLTKIFKDFWLRDRARAVDGVTFDVRQGEVFGLLGPNGSGKSTTIKLILGLLKKTRGRLTVFGRSPHDVAVKRRIGYLPEESYLYPFLDARETLDYYGRLFGLEHRTRAKRIDELLDMVGLAAVQHRQVREYSKGMQRRIGIAQALINDPEFLILDEPTTGLDPLGTRQIKDLIIHLGRRGKTILLSSHLLSDVEDCVDRMVILYGGRIRAEGSCDDLLESKDRNVIETDSLDPQTIAEIRGVLDRHSKRALRVARPRQRLEDLFIDIVEQARAERIATSGAEGGGRTAGFLLGESQDQGAALVDRLVAAADNPIGPAAPAPVEERRGPDRSVIEDLVSAAPARDDAPPEKRPAAPADQPDLEVIEGLLSGERGRSTDGPAPREPR